LLTKTRGQALVSGKSLIVLSVSHAKTQFLLHSPLAHLEPAIAQLTKKQTHFAPVSNATVTASCTHRHFVVLQAKPRCLCFHKIINALVSLMLSKLHKLQRQLHELWHSTSLSPKRSRSVMIVAMGQVDTHPKMH
jgi:hypothetical protein